VNQEEIEEQFDDWLDDVYPTYEIAGITLRPSQMLKNCDPIAYRIALSEYDYREEEWKGYFDNE
jgi:hypothetical protein